MKLYDGTRVTQVHRPVQQQSSNQYSMSEESVQTHIHMPQAPVLY